VNRLLEGKIAIVTGSGRGIGRATAELFSAHGARIVAADLDAEVLKEAAAAIQAAGGEALALKGDVTDPLFPERLMERTLQRFGGLDILVNNAGFTWDGTIHKMTDEQWQGVLDVHLTSPFRMIRAAAAYLRETAKNEQAKDGQARPRKIINISSTSGTRGNAGQSNYAAAKAGVVGLTKALAREWGQFNIQVNAVAFGWIDTRLTQEKEKGVKIQRGKAEIPLGIPAERREAMSKLIPLGRPGTPQEAAGVLLFFASPLSDFVSGQVLEVTGGL
jgi:3-oxoacyl-[acyl-carrier protein] reductase